MDCRNFVDKAPDYKKGQELEYLYDLHKGLLNQYISIEGLPNYPIGVNSRKGQSVIKDMIARVIEELGEGFESTTYALQMLDKFGYNFDIWSRDNYQMLLNHLQNSNEEQVDALAFYLNLLMYSNIQPDDIYSYSNNKLKAHVHGCLNLNDLMSVGYDLLMARVTNTKLEAQHQWRVFDEEKFTNLIGGDYDRVKKYIPAFHELDWYWHDLEAEMAWEISWHLSVARNYLKNKPWKQTMEMTDESRYQEEIVYSFILLLGYFKYIGFDVESLVRLRYYKHLVCEFRIKSNY